MSVHTVEGLPLIGLPPRAVDRAPRVLIKRAIDVVGSARALIVLAPLMAYIALRVRLDSPGPILFRQTRLGADDEGVHDAEVPHDEGRHRPAAHRAYIRETMNAGDAEAETGSSSSTAPMR